MEDVSKPAVSQTGTSEGGQYGTNPLSTSSSQRGAPSRARGGMPAGTSSRMSGKRRANIPQAGSPEKKRSVEGATVAPAPKVVVGDRGAQHKSRGSLGRGAPRDERPPGDRSSLRAGGKPNVAQKEHIVSIFDVDPTQWICNPRHPAKVCWCLHVVNPTLDTDTRCPDFQTRHGCHTSPCDRLHVIYNAFAPTTKRCKKFKRTYGTAKIRCELYDRQVPHNIKTCRKVHDANPLSKLVYNCSEFAMTGKCRRTLCPLMHNVNRFAGRIFSKKAKK